MKKNALTLLLFLSLSFLLCGIQSSLYFLPLPVPYFWFIILTYYSFNKNLAFALLCNFLHIFVISQFSSVHLSSLLINMNILTLIFLIFRDRFHIGLLQTSLSAGLGCLTFLIISWTLNSMLYGIYIPNILSWIGISLMTSLFSILIIPIVKTVDKKIHTERVDTLENLRI